MSTHVVPDAERLRHLLTMECPCRPVHQAALDLDLEPVPGRAGAGQGQAWVIMHHELIARLDDHGEVERA